MLAQVGYALVGKFAHLFLGLSPLLSQINWDYAFYCLIMTFLSICAFFSMKFIDFKIGAPLGYIRFEEPEAAQKAHTASLMLSSPNKGVSLLRITLPF
jgi:hypothetical protein